jgi:hypothetical protein
MSATPHAIDRHGFMPSSIPERSSSSRPRLSQTDPLPPTDGRLVPRTSYDGSMESHPDQRRPVPRVHPLEIPFVWFGLQLIEFALVWLLISTFVPEDTPSGVGIAAFLAIWVAVSIINYRIRRRFIPR